MSVDSLPPALRPLATRFEFEELLAIGGFAYVYKATRKDDNLLVGIKVPFSVFLPGGATVDLGFLKEAENWKNLEHEYIVRVVEFDSKPVPYIATEWMAGGSLRSRIGRLTVAEALTIAAQIASALFHAHRHGVVHLDIKPENILFDARDLAKLTDWGLSKIMLERSGHSRSRMGTPAYAAPEQWRPRQYGGREWETDVWQFGVTLYEMLTGKLPFPAEDDAELEDCILKEEPVPFAAAGAADRGIPSSVESLVMRCLRKRKEDRFPGFESIKEQIQILCQPARTVAATQASPLPGEVVPRAETGEHSAREWTDSGVTLGNLGKYQEAIASYDKALEIDPKYVYAWNNKGAALGKLGKYQEAIASYDKALEIDPKYVLAWNNKGAALHKLGKYQEAIDCYDKAVNIDGNFAWAWSNKGDALGNLGRHQEAIGCYDKALDVDPKYTWAWNQKGMRLGSLGKHQEAIVCYDKAIELEGNFAWAWSNKGDVLDDLGRCEEAIACYDRGIELGPTPGAWNNKGWALQRLGRYEEAAACYDKAVDLDPEFARAWSNKGIALAYLGNDAEAVACYDKALEKKPGYANTWHYKGMALARMGKYAEAIACYDKALKRDPNLHSVLFWPKAVLKTLEALKTLRRWGNRRV